MLGVACLVSVFGMSVVSTVGSAKMRGGTRTHITPTRTKHTHTSHAAALTELFQSRFLPTNQPTDHVAQHYHPTNQPTNQLTYARLICLFRSPARMPRQRLRREGRRGDSSSFCRLLLCIDGDGLLHWTCVLFLMCSRPLRKPHMALPGFW